jgi:amino acid adenylation domain-containing protein
MKNIDIAHFEPHADMEYQSVKAGSSRFASLTSMLDARASASPTATAYVWLPTGEEESERVSYDALRCSSRSIAAFLTNRGERGFAALLYPPGLEFISALFGCLYAGVTAVPLRLPRHGRDMAGVLNILKDCGASLILTSASAADRIRKLIEEGSQSGIPVVATDGIGPCPAGNSDLQIDLDRVAYIQYTSGSTNNPKGVVISHRNVLSNLELVDLRQGLSRSRDSVEVSWLPIFHDLGLVYGILQPIFSGCPCILMPPMAFIQNPIRWLMTISKYRGTHTAGPNFAYELCIRSKSRLEGVSLDLSCWRLALNGAEPIAADTLERFESAFHKYGFQMRSFYPAYGLAEATLDVSGGLVGEGPKIECFDREELGKGIAAPGDSIGRRVTRLVSSGRVNDGNNTLIVDPYTLEVMPEHRIGEIWIQSESVAGGYLNNQKDTERVFGAFTKDKFGPFLRSGDLGFLDGDQLFVTGRLKDLIIIQGENFYPHDLEQAVERGETRAKSGSVIAFSIPDPSSNAEEVVVVLETRVKTQPAFEPIASAVRGDVMASVGLVVKYVVGIPPATLPRTSSGKLRRAACRSAFLHETLKISFISNLPSHESQAFSNDSTLPDFRSPLQHTAERITGIIVNKLCELLDLEPDSVGIDLDLTAVGLDSLSALQLAFKIQELFGTQFTAGDVLSCRIVRSIVQRIQDSVEANALAAKSGLNVRGQKTYCLSYSQRSLLYRHHLSGGSDALNIAQVVEVESAFNEDILEEALAVVVGRHSALRSTFPGFPEEQVAHVLDRTDVPIAVQRVLTQKESVRAEVQQIVSRPFDLNTGPLFRVGVVRSSSSNPVVVFVLHHAICDLWSLVLLLDEIWREYSLISRGIAHRPALPSADFDDYTRSEEEYLRSQEGGEAAAYWKEVSKSPLQALNFSRSSSSPKKWVYNVNRENFLISSEAVKRLRMCARSLNVTLFELCFALVRAVLQGYSASPKGALGISVHNRSSARFAQTVGCLINVLPIRSELRPEWTVKEALGQVTGAIRAATKHGSYPFQLIREQMARDRDATPESTLEVMVNFYKTGMPGLDSSFMPMILGHPGRRVDIHEATLVGGEPFNRNGQHQMTWSFGECQGDLLGTLEWSTDLLSEEFVLAVVRHYQSIAALLPDMLDRTIGELLYASDLVLQKQIAAWNDTELPREKYLTLQAAFERQAGLTPSECAIISGDRSLTYQEVNDAAQLLAGVLHEHGAGQDRIVGLCADRGEWAIIGILAILKANAAYMPIDPEYPDDRIAKMIAKAGCRIVICGGAYVQRIQCLVPDVICLSVESSSTTNSYNRDPGKDDVDTLAYVIFTSGSTGEPKGAMVSHRAIWNRVQWMHEKYQLSRGERVLQKSPFTFDVSVWEIFWPLVVGGTVVLADPGGHRDPLYIAKLIDEAKISTVHFVPSMLRAFHEATDGRSFPGLKRVICSGEALPSQLAAEFSKNQSAYLENLYGPTEAAVDVTSHRFHGTATGPETVSIGTPISNVETYVLDEMMYPAPIGAAGELYIGGVAVARGYVANPGMTAERFVPDPYGRREGQRLYRTGDLVRYDKEGHLQFIGRNDNQVKIRGQRVELGEIECSIRAHAEIKDCCVRLLNAGTPSECLAAYAIVAGDEQRVIQEMKQLLKSTLPAYMIPGRFIPMESFPMTANGKLDTSRLPLSAEAPGENAWDEPERQPNAVENVVLEVWREVLNLPSIHLEDSFFALGGHSIAATQVMSRLRKRLAVQLPLAMIFSDEATVASVAKEISTRIPPDSRLLHERV